MAKKKILIVDDEEDICTFSKSILEKTGRFEVAATTNSTQAIQLAKNFLPDLVVLDINMPEIDGGDIAQELGKDAATKDIQILFVTGLLRKSEMPAGMIGKYHFIAKPVEPKNLIAEIDILLSGSV